MASTSTQRACSSSSSTPSWRYEVFLNFCGEDTRNSFTDHLYAALKQKDIIVFRDDEKLERGKNVYEELLKAIQESTYAITVISANYASSRWCLIELAQIVECTRDTGLTILPIFYHVDPSDVRNQTETFVKAFAKHEASLREQNPKFDNDDMQKWRAALREVGNISGWHVDDDRRESKVVEEISRRILSGLGRNFSNVSKDLVGIESRVKEVMSLLSIGLHDVRFLGICGMGGIGKTTLSQVIYDRVYHQFEASCFIASIREETKTHGLLYLQKQLISEILMEREINIWNSFGAIKVIRNRVRNKKIFIVLDDVDGEEQLNALAGSHDWFGLGSRIIITSRDRHLLNKLVNNTYEVKKLNDAEALRLFSWKAFKKPHFEENYVKLSMDIVNYAQGLPLALEVFGSFLFGRTMDAWKSARNLLKENPNAEILDKLRISFDGLEDLQKKLFLDIACFFNGADIDSIIHKLESFGYYPNISIQILVDKSLITISQGRLWMHDLLRKMGQKIVRCESAEEPGGCSRLWHYEDVLHVLKNNTGTNAVKGVVLKSPLQKRERLNIEAFSKMTKLKMLEISNVDNLSNDLDWHGDPSNFMLSNELCVMEWWGYPFESLPASFESDNLVELIMRYSRIKQPWDGRKSFDKLKRIDLSYSQSLIETPDLNGVPNLEKLELCYTNLSKVHPSIGFLRRLKELDLRDCKSLKRLPDMISLESLEDLNLSGCSRLNEFPDIVGHMTSLRKLYLIGTAIKKLPLSFTSLSSLVFLNISDCSRLEKIPMDLSGLECLEYLYADGTAIRELPSSIVFLKKLRVLVVGGKRDSYPISLLVPNSFSGLSSLYKLDLSYRNLMDGEIPSDLSCLSSLRFLNLSGNDFTRLPDSVAQISHLQKLYLEDCRWLQGLLKLPLGLEVLGVKNCPLLDRWTSNKGFWSIYCSFVDYEGKPCKILHLRPQGTLWMRIGEFTSTSTFRNDTQRYDTEIACGHALLGSGIPGWFNDKSTNSFGTIRMHTDEWKGYALFIVYQVHEDGNSNSRTFDGSNPNFPYFVCQFQANEEVDLGDDFDQVDFDLGDDLGDDFDQVDFDLGDDFDGSNPNFPYFECQFQANEEVDLGDDFDQNSPLVLCVPVDRSVGPSGFWVYIPAEWFRRRSFGGTWLKASIAAGSQNVEVKECGARAVRQHDVSEFYQVLNSISPQGFDLESCENLFFRLDNGRLGLEVL